MPFVPTDPVIARWHRFLEGVQVPPRSFYDRVEDLVDGLQIPRLKRSRVHWPEQGALSSAREYLRFERLGYRFDICAAPFGKGFFISWWLVRPLPTWYGILGWHLASAIILVTAFGLIQVVSGTGATIAGSLGSGVVLKDNGLLVLTTVLGLLLHLLLSLLGPPIILFLAYHVCVRLAFASVQTIQAILVLGPLYTRFFNPVTYYALDTAQMFQDAVHGAVVTALDQATEGKGVRAMTDLERPPMPYELAGS